jgi:hypothetical protein
MKDHRERGDRDVRLPRSFAGEDVDRTDAGIEPVDDAAFAVGERDPRPGDLAADRVATQLVRELEDLPDSDASRGCPFDIRPPPGLTGIRPPMRVSPPAMAGPLMPGST